MPPEVKSKPHLKIQNFGFCIAMLIFTFCIFNFSYAAPCYGTKMPKKNKFFASFESYSLFKRYLANSRGKLRSQQEFYGMSYGVFNWLSIDLKAGAGTVKQHPLGSDEVDYAASFAGGYGLRLKFLDKNNFKAVLGFQHISIHPKHTYVWGVKNRAILDDWQWSILASYDFKRITPYLGTRWSRVDYIHCVGEDRKRRMSDFTKSTGFIYGLDIPLTKKIWLNLEGSAFDSDAFACSLNYCF